MDKECPKRAHEMDEDETRIILLADKSALIRIRDALTGDRWSDRLITVDDVPAAIRLLESIPVDVVLFSMQHDKSADLESLQQIRFARSDVPVIVVTDNTHEEAVLEILKCGAEDFLNFENLTPAVLARVIRYSLERSKLIRDRIQLQKLVLETGRRERQRISSDLHDSVGQELTGLNMLAASLCRKLSARELPEAESAEAISTGIHSALKQIREIINGLMPVAVEPEGLRTALDQLCRQTEERTGIACQLDCPSETLFEDIETATQMFRIAQESINNAVKHSGANRIVVRFERRAQSSVLQIMDDGIGFNPMTENGHGFGMRIMNHRCELIGANLQILSHPGSGTVIHCSVNQQRDQSRPVG